MGPIPKRSAIIEQLPLSPADRLIHAGSALFRRLPPPVVRALALADLMLAAVMPVWFWFAFRRWSGVRLSAAEARRLYVRAARFTQAHLQHRDGDTGLALVDWFSRPIREAPLRERADYPNKGSCGTCFNCCTTHWLPEPKRHTCPFLGDDGCRVYGGLWWDYFNCGRYPARPIDTRVYACPRFEGPIEVPDAFPAELELEHVQS